MNMTDRRRTAPNDYRCGWCGVATEAETGYRGYDPHGPLAEFRGTVGVVVCTPGCPGRPEGAKITDKARRVA